MGNPTRHTLYTWTTQADVSPIALAGGLGAWFFDAQGRRYLDLASVSVNVNAGHNHPAILAAMRAQIDDLAVAGPAMSTRVRERVGEALAQVTPPGIDRFLFTLGGADAVEHAVKIARLVTGRAGVVCRAHSYHGATLGALSFSDDPRADPFRPGLPGVVRVRDPWCERCPWGTTPEVCARPCIDHVGEVIEAHGPHTIAAVLMETIPGTQAGYLPPRDYYAGIRALCDRHGILLILDEVLTGFGRTGRWFGLDHYDVRADLLALGKGITSGHAPLGAVAMSREVAAHFDHHVLATGMTHTAHPVSLAAAEGNLEALRGEGLVERARAIGAHLAERLARMMHLRGVVRSRGLGLYGSLELEGEARAAALRAAMLRRRIHMLARGPFAYVAPPLVIAQADLDRGLDTLAECLEDLPA